MKNLIEFKGAATTLYLTAEQAEQLALNSAVIAVTTNVARTIVLPAYSTLVNTSGQFLVVDETGGAATYPVTISRYGAPDKINGANNIQLDVAYGSVLVKAGSLPSQNSQWVAFFGGGGSNSQSGNTPSLGWNVSASCDVVTHATTYTITALKTITHPFILYGTSIFVSSNAGGIGGRGFLSINAGDIVTAISTDTIDSPLDLLFVDSLGNWSNIIPAYECHA